MRHHRLRRLRQQHADAVAARDALGFQQVRQAAGAAVQVVEADALDRAVLAQVDQRGTAAAGPAVAGLLGDVAARGWDQRNLDPNLS
jgi:hypothetical protein